MAKQRTHQGRDEWEDRFFEQQARELSGIKSDIKDVGKIATKAHTQAREASKQAKLTNGRVTVLEQAVTENQVSINRLANKALATALATRRRLLGLEKVVLPNKIPEPDQLKQQVKATPFW